MSAAPRSNITPLVVLVVVSVAVVGYFTGMQSPMNPARPPERPPRTFDGPHEGVSGGEAPPATSYADMAVLLSREAPTTNLTRLHSNFDPLAEIQIEPNEKTKALEKREQNRSFNGAPPTIPHLIEQRSAASCVACHADGVKTATLRIPRMSHEFLENCTQCHVESSPDFMPAVVFRDNGFEGLPAPQGGPRAYEGAPPQIPHSTWMRSDCLSCHGYAGLQGLRTTHPWRLNCQQCHAPSSSMDQTLLAVEPRFLPAPEIEG